MPAPGKYVVRHSGGIDRYYFTSEKTAMKFARSMAQEHGDARVFRERSDGYETPLARFDRRGKRLAV